MSKKFMLAAVAVVCAASLLLPASALAKAAKAGTGFRGVGSYMVRPHGAQTLDVSGRLVQRKRVYRSRRWQVVDVPLDGGVYLQYSRYVGLGVFGPYRNVAWAHASHGTFRFTVETLGAYRLVHVQTKSTKKSAKELTIWGRDFSVDSITPLEASRTASGSVVVTIGVDFKAPASMISTRAPGISDMRITQCADSSPIGSLLDASGLETPGSVYAAAGEPTEDSFELWLHRPGVNVYSFTVPSSAVHSTIMVEADLYVPRLDAWERPAARTATFTPDDLVR